MAKTTSELLLDSSLIVTTNKDLYNIKIVRCNDYIQVYYLPNTKTKINKNVETISNIKSSSIKNIDTDDLKKEENIKKENIIEEKNIIRSKLQCQRLAKCNARSWKTFITLTIADNITDIKVANKKLRYFIDKVQRVYPNFKYICVPEFQKRGAVHYHLLTNISINDEKLIYAQTDNAKFKHIKYWNEGYTKVDTVENDIKKIIGYISKYMTKDIDNRLYNCHRYFYSRNLSKPTIEYLDLTNDKHLQYYEKTLLNRGLIYENNYINPYTNETLIFKEYLVPNYNSLLSSSN